MMNKVLKSVFVLIFASCFFVNLQGQGFLKIYGEQDFQTGVSIIRTLDNKFILVGENSVDSIMIIKTDDLGEEEWTIFIQNPDLNMSRSLIENSAGNYMLLTGTWNSGLTNIYEISPLGSVLSSQQMNCNCRGIAQAFDGNYVTTARLGDEYTSDIRVFKFDLNGDEIWSHVYDNQEIDAARNIFSVSNGGFVIFGVSRNGLTTDDNGLLIKISDDGAEEWSIQFDDIRFVYDAIETQDGNIVVIGQNAPGINEEIHYQKFSNQGEVIWKKSYEGNSDFIVGNAITETLTGDLVIIGDEHTSFSSTGKSIVIGTDSGGNLLYETAIDVPDDDVFADIIETGDNGVALIGTHKELVSTGFFYRNFMLAKLDPFGNLFTNLLEGNVYEDFNQNCAFESDEFPLKNWIVEAEGNFKTYRITDTNGDYSFLLDTGNYEIKVYPPNNYWTVCEESYPINFPSFFDTTTLNVPIQPLVNCPRMQVQISNNTLRPCPLPNKIIVQYCNEGTITAEDALLEVTLHEYMAVDSISIDPATITGDLYTFDLGDLEPFDCGQITFHFQLECDSVQLGQTLCAEAHIYPDTLCLDPIWTGPVISVDGQCHPDSITFFIENEGDDMPDPQQYIIIEDNIILMQEPYQLLNGEMQEITIPKIDEATYFMLAEQSPNLPSTLGNNYATFAIEDCEALPLTSIFNQFPLDDAEPYFDEMCREVTGSYDPNDKQGFPTGFGEDHHIEQNVDLDYLIRFQNTGTDTAFTVIIRDNLSEFLDLTTLRPGTSSHEYNLEIVNGRTLKFTFNNILLPDSTTNEPLSHGWVEFNIAQVVDNPIGTLIENRADIYFDGNAPILTNTTEHLIGVDLIDILDETTQVFRPDVELKVYPNPASEYAIFELENVENEQLTFKLYNAAGQLQRVENFVENEYYFYRNELLSGLYFYQIESDGALLVTGKLVLR